MSKWRQENYWCDQCGDYNCSRHSFGQAILTAVVSGMMVGGFGTILFLLFR